MGCKMYIFGELITNLNRNRVLTITSIFTVFIMLLLVGVFGVFLLNISYNSEYMDNMLEIRIFITPGADEYRENLIKEALVEDGNINYLEFESNEQAFENAKEMFDSQVLDNLGADFLPASYTVRLRDNVNVKDFVAFVESVPDVYRVDYHSGSFDFAVSLTNWINLISGLLAVLLGILSLFLISNTVRLAMASRNEEVIIMKYIGATEGRIKIPFILEGTVIGFTGAMGASLLISYLYNRVFEWFSTQGAEELFLAGLKLVSVKYTVLMIFLVFFGLAILLGIFGSLLAIRKNLRV
ncbi:MAG: ABC transporter permease [Clostridiales bacterium]|nr:ABC transporter permease [Clostridiales bacterium]